MVKDFQILGGSNMLNGTLRDLREKYPFINFNEYSFNVSNYYQFKNGKFGQYPKEPSSLRILTIEQLEQELQQLTQQSTHCEIW